MQRIDPVIDFTWGLGGPDPRIGVDLFQAKWEAMLQAPYSETYAITVVGDDGVRSWAVDYQLLIDEWHEQHPAKATTAEISLAAGQTYSLRLDYFEGWGDATVQLYWSSPSTPGHLSPRANSIPTGLQLFPDSEQQWNPGSLGRTYGFVFRQFDDRCGWHTVYQSDSGGDGSQFGECQQEIGGWLAEPGHWTGGHCRDKQPFREPVRRGRGGVADI